MEIIVALQSLANPPLDAVALWLTHLGSENAYIVLLLIVYLAIDPRAGRLLGLALLGGYYVNQVAKDLADTARPYVVDPTLLRSEAAGHTAPGPAFPSGHAQLAATFWGLAAVLARRRAFTWLAVALILVIALTRVYLGVHWPIDVLGGLVLGGCVAALAVAAGGLGGRVSAPIQAVVWGVLPLLAHLLWPTADSGLIAGALAGFGTGPLVVRHRVPRSRPRRAAVAALGLVLVFAWLLGTSVALPEAVKDHAAIEPLRYFALAWMGLVVAPLLARTGTVGAGDGRG